MENCHSCASYLKCKLKTKVAFKGCPEYESMSSEHTTKIIQQSWTSLKFEEQEDDESRLLVPEGALDDHPLVPNKKRLPREYTEEDENEFVNMIDSILNDKSGSGLVPPDVRVDDRDLKEFPNFWAWSTDPKGAGVRPFARQLWIGAKLFHEMCWYCSADRKMVEDVQNVPIGMDIEEMAERIQFLEFGTCPSCERTKMDLHGKGKLDLCQEFIGVIGQRAGKSLMTTLFIGYLNHRLLKLQKPNEVYGVPINQILTGTCVGLTFNDSIALLWTPLRELMENSPWFQEYHKILDHNGNKYGEELYKFGELSIAYRHRNLFFCPQGADKRKLRGRTRVWSAIDELGWWPIGANEKDMEKSGSEVYGALDRSLKTIRGSVTELWDQGYVNVPGAYAFNVSSPSNVMDVIMRMYRASKHNPEMLGIQLPTWEINPKMPRSKFNSDYLKDPVAAERDYGANPPLSANSFIEGNDTIDRAFCLPTDRVDFEYLFKTIDGKLRQGVKVNKMNQGGKDLPPAILAIDAGYSNNSFAIVIGYIVRSKNPKELPTYEFPILLDVIPNNGAHLSHNQIFKHLILPLIDTFNVQAVVADRWNSKMLLDSVTEDKGIFAANYSVKMVDFEAAKSYLEGGKVKFPKLVTEAAKIVDIDTESYPQSFNYMPADHLYLQLHTVVNVIRTVEKGPGLTDDVFRAWILAQRFLLDEEWVKENLKNVKIRGSVALGNAVGRSGGGSGSGMSSSVGSVSSRGGGR